MRAQLCDALVLQSQKTEMIFLTADLGFMALEPLQASLGNKFINAGISEQNMISVSAALAKKDFNVWVYSIAPFLYARAFEQIRNDIAFHGLPVKLIGNGGGYGYGVMGPTHHAIEDYGVLLSLPNMKVYIPAFADDVLPVVCEAQKNGVPTYIRMGRSEAPKGFLAPSYNSWRQLTFGEGEVVIAVGPLATTYIEAFQQVDKYHRPNLWVITELPLESSPLPKELINQMVVKGSLLVIEEHVRHGGFGSDLQLFLLENKISVPNFRHIFAKKHNFGIYGSQNFLRTQSGIDVNSVIRELGLG